MYMYVTESGKISDCWLFLTGLKLIYLKCVCLKSAVYLQYTVYQHVCLQFNFDKDFKSCYFGPSA